MSAGHNYAFMLNCLHIIKAEYIQLEEEKKSKK